MSINPQFNLIFGVEFTLNYDESTKNIVDDFYKYKDGHNDVGLAWIDSANKYIVGSLVEEGECGSRILYSLSSLYDKYLRDGFSVIPPVNPEIYHHLSYYYALCSLHKSGRLDGHVISLIKSELKNPDGFLKDLLTYKRNGWLQFKQDFDSIKHYVDRSKVILKDLNIPYIDKDLKLMLCWTWV